VTPADTEVSASALASAAADQAPAASRAPGYASGTLVDQIQARVRDVLSETEGDIEESQAALIHGSCSS
jgi:hypothetical protein